MKENYLLLKDQFIETLILIIVFAAVYFILKLFVSKTKLIEEPKKFMTRTKITMVVGFVLLLLLVWIPVLWALLAVLGFVAGALVLTQKFNIQNLVGYVIISWRELFEVGDIIQISHYVGKVRSIGPFYFTLYEVSMEGRFAVSGNIVKIPNGLVSKDPLINHSDRKVHKIFLSYIFDKDTKLEKLQAWLDELQPKIKTSLENNKRKSKDIECIKISYHYYLKQSEPAGIKVAITVESHFDLLGEIQQLIEIQIIDISQNGKAINLSF